MDGHIDYPEAGGSPDAFRSAWRSREHGVPVAQYVDRDFARLEAAKLWPKTWQVACRLEEIPDPGDYTVYEILDQSVVVVRQADGSVKAHHNVCPHRATALAVGAGRFQLEQIVCPFHGWKWSLEGDNTFVLDAAAFPPACLDPEAIRLKACRTATWLNCVWINLEPGAEDFEDYISPLRDTFDALLLDQMYVHWHKSFVLEANWKVAQEAFFEGYHVPQTHPQLPRRSFRQAPGFDMQAASAARARNFHVRLLPQGHGFQGSTDGGVRGLGRFAKEAWDGLGQAEQVEMLIHYHEQFALELGSMILDDDVDAARTLRRRPMPADADVDGEFQRVVREHYASSGRAIASAAALSRAGLCHVFPNYTFLPLYGNVLIYRTRPLRDNDPDRCRFEVWSCRTLPAGAAPSRPEAEVITDPMDPAQMVMFLRQDFSNIPRQQLGMHSLGIEANILHPQQEALIANMHQALDRKLGA